MDFKDINIAVVHTGSQDQVLNKTFNSREWEGYLGNAKDIGDVLTKLNFNVSVIEDGIQIISRLEEIMPDMVWVCSGGIQGRNSAAHLPSILEMLGIPYIGSPPLASAIADDKSYSKIIADHHGVKTPTYQVFNSPDDLLKKELEFPLIVKPNSGLCACGVYKANNIHELQTYVEVLMSHYHSPVLVESFIPGRDITISVLERESDLLVLPPLERFFEWGDSTRINEHFTKAHPNSTLSEGSAKSINIGPELLKRISQNSCTMFHAIGLRAFCRFDFRLGEDDLYFLEANYKPDLMKNSLFAKSAALHGIEYQALIKKILNVFHKKQRRET
ncbi:MAG: D-alanine--D-alanine ligase family protein [Ardenticatenaceae bacterium]